jgi:hypothetical protein
MKIKDYTFIRIKLLNKEEIDAFGRLPRKDPSIVTLAPYLLRLGVWFG